MAIQLYSYLDYRKFLKDFYELKKSEKSSFSFRVFANQAGFKSKSFIQDIIQGKRNMSQESVFKLAIYFKFTPKQIAYFQDIVEYDQAKTQEQKEFFIKRILELNSRNKVAKILKKQFEFYSTWYHNSIRELVSIYDFKDNYERLAELLIPTITPAQAKHSVELLLDLGLIQKTDNGYVLNNPTISTGDEVNSTFVNMFHDQNFQLAKESVNNFSQLERDISCVVLKLSKKRFKEIKKEIQDFRKKILSLESSDEDAERVFHLSFQTFPTTKAIRCNK